MGRSFATVEERGDAMARAKQQRIAQEKRLELARANVNFLQLQEAEAKKKIAEMKDKAMERMQTVARMHADKRGSAEHKGDQAWELEQRKLAVADQRRQNRQAIEAKRLALLEARHADFVRKKQQAAEARVTILAARAAKQQQKQALTESVRQQQLVARERLKLLQQEKQESLARHEAIRQAHEESEVEETRAQLRMLAAEEERLLGAVLQRHDEHRTAFDELTTSQPGYRRGLVTSALAPTSLAVPQPLRPGSAMLERRIDPAIGVGRGGSASAPSSRPSSARSARSAATSRFGNSVPPSPAAWPPSAPLTPRPFSAASHRSTRSTRSARSGAFASSPVAQGATCMMSAPHTVATIQPVPSRATRRPPMHF